MTTNWDFLIGQRSGKLTAVEIIGVRGKNTFCRCKCDCGGYIEVACSKIKTQHAKSCGCLSNHRPTNSNKGRKLNSHAHKHGCCVGSKSRLYMVWQTMVARCNDPHRAYFERYGGRGIKVCDEWLPANNGFVHFRDWSLANGYNELETYKSGKNLLTIDRINNNGNYEPSNCRWTTWSVQNSNKSRSVN